MSPQRRGSRRGTGWKPPRDRREIVIATLASLAIIVVTVALVWFLRPNRDSVATPTPDTTPVTASTSAPGETTTIPPTTAPASSTP